MYEQMGINPQTVFDGDKQIIIMGNPILYTKAEAIPKSEFGSLGSTTSRTPQGCNLPYSCIRNSCATNRGCILDSKTLINFRQV